MRRYLSLKTLSIVFVALLLLGLIFDASNGFLLLRNIQSAPLAIAGLILLGIVYGLGTGGVEWIASKDKASNPLYKRAFHLFLLLGYLGALGLACGFVLKKLGWS
jgi:hypothetical protein